MDLSGKLIIKVQLGDDIRRIPIHNEDITYDELVLMMQRVFRGRLNNDDDILIKYKDEDQDLVTIFDDSDLSFAIQCSRILKITLFVNGHTKSPADSFQLRSIKRELQSIRDRVNSLLDQIEPSEQEITSTNDSKHLKVAKEEPMVVSESGHRSEQNTPSRSTDVTQGKEFDPFSSQKSVDDSVQNKVTSAFGVGGQERSGTPDSISSIGSSSKQYQPSPVQVTSTPTTHPSAFVTPQPVVQSHSAPQTSSSQEQQMSQQHPGQPAFQQQQQYPSPQHYAQQATGFPSGGPQQQTTQVPQLQQPQRSFQQQPPNIQPQRQPSPSGQGMPPGQPGMTSQVPRPGMPPGQGMHGMPQGQQGQGPPQGQQGMSPGQSGFPQQGGGGGQFGFQQYGGQNMPQGQMPSSMSSAPWNPQQQQQQGMYQGGYAGQPQPGATQPNSPSPGPGIQSNPYSRGPTGAGGYTGYPKPAQSYPAGYK